MTTILSLFTGAGGLDIGFEAVDGFETLARVEHQPEYAATIQHAVRHARLRPAHLVVDDVRSLDPDKLFPSRRASVLGVIGGPPCETFSSMGRRQGSSDPRGLLI